MNHFRRSVYVVSLVLNWYLTQWSYKIGEELVRSSGPIGNYNRRRFSGKTYDHPFLAIGDLHQV